MFRLFSMFVLTCLVAIPVSAEWAHIQADRDATLIESTDGSAANGSGPSMFAGHTNQQLFGVRRALVRFDVASALPADAIIDRVFLSLYENSNNAAPSEVSLYRVLADWGEGASMSGGGSGAAAEPGDATWLHTFHDYEYWSHQGGHFSPQVSATTTVGSGDFYTWQSTKRMVKNVRHWLNNPSHNFGWLIMGDEYTRGSAKKFTSRTGTIGEQPMLSVEYHLPGK